MHTYQKRFESERQRAESKQSSDNEKWNFAHQLIRKNVPKEGVGSKVQGQMIEESRV